MVKRLTWVCTLVLFMGCSGLTGTSASAAAPIAIDAGKKLIESVVSYLESKGKKAKQVNCEEEWHPETKELLILCTAKYEEKP